MAIMAGASAANEITLRIKVHLWNSLKNKTTHQLWWSMIEEPMSLVTQKVATAAINSLSLDFLYLREKKNSLFKAIVNSLLVAVNANSLYNIMDK